jgi:hypothetical protein
MAGMSVRATIALAAAIGLVLGVLVGATLEVPFAPEAGAVLGGLVGWRLYRNRR